MPLKKSVNPLLGACGYKKVNSSYHVVVKIVGNLAQALQVSGVPPEADSGYAIVSTFPNPPEAENADT